MITTWHVVPKTVLPGALLQGHIPVEIKIQKDSENYLKMTSLKSLNKQVFSSETNASPWPKQQNKMPTPTRKRTKDQQKGAEGLRIREPRSQNRGVGAQSHHSSHSSSASLRYHRMGNTGGTDIKQLKKDGTKGSPCWNLQSGNIILDMAWQSKTLEKLCTI